MTAVKLDLETELECLYGCNYSAGCVSKLGTDYLDTEEVGHGHVTAT